MKHFDIAVIGAGPYGLSISAHIRSLDRNAIVFGEPMSFWNRQMPKGMLLRSPWAASHLSDPDGKFTLEAYRESDNKHFFAPVPREHFVDYGLWFKSKTTPDIDSRNVARVEKNGNFRLTLSDGEEVSASRVVVAAGIAPFPRWPTQFADLPKTVVSHSSEQSDFAPFKARKVAVIGAGQSAIESAALLHEAGAEVEIVVRSPKGIRLRRKKGLHANDFLERLLYAPTDVGPAGMSHLIARPNWFRMLPRNLRDRLDVRAIRPFGAAWLRPRVEEIPVSTGRMVVSATRINDRVNLILDDGGQRLVDHVLLATGYRVDISKYQFLAPAMLVAIDKVNGFPRLDSGFECSVRGLHFVGAPAAWSFGPLMRFVAGAGFAALSITKAIVGERSCKYQTQSSRA